MSPLIGGWKSYVDPSHVACWEVWAAGKDFIVVATLAVVDRDGQPKRHRMSAAFPTEEEALAEMKRIVSEAGCDLLIDMVLPDPEPGPVT